MAEMFELVPSGRAVPKAVAKAAGDGVILLALPGGEYMAIPDAEASPDGIDGLYFYDENGQETVCWVSDEWRDDPVLVMGAIFGKMVG